MSGGWNTIESDAGVFTYLIESLGARDIQFEELLSLDAAELRALAPVYGVIFLFKYPQAAAAAAAATEPPDGVYDHEAGRTLFFARQTIQNACGTQALLSVLLNHGDAGERPHIDLGAHLTDYLAFTGALPPDLRGEALSNDETIRAAHNGFARSSPFADETARPDGTDAEDAFHFVAYTPVRGVLYELDGLQPAPIAHGACGFGEFAERVVPVLRRRVGAYGAGEIRFNLLACCGDLRARAREFGDPDALEREEARRRGWLWENALRRHNFLGFAGEVLRGVVAVKAGEGAYEAWVEGAKAATRRRVEMRRGKDEGGGMDVDG